MSELDKQWPIGGEETHTMSPAEAGQPGYIPRAPAAPLAGVIVEEVQVCTLCGNTNIGKTWMGSFCPNNAGGRHVTKFVPVMIPLG